MNYGYTTLATDWNEQEMNDLRVRLLKAILFFIPRANPDNEKLYPLVHKWFIEIDDQGIANREIAIDINNQPIFLAPDDRNFGLWTDSDNIFELKELELSSKENFELIWGQLEENT